MKLKRTQSDENLMLSISEAELLVIKSALREVFASLDRRDFQLRLGAAFDVVAEVSAELDEQMREIGIEE